mgnify:CR=1 FL=1
MTRYIPEALPAFQHTWRIVCREAEGFADVRDRLFADAPTLERLTQLGDDKALADRIEAFGSRFTRLQDQLGEKTLPRLLALFGSSPKALLDTLQAAEPAAALLLNTVDRIRRLLAERAIPES